MDSCFFHFLRKQLQREQLPGRPSQLKMVPRPLDKEGKMREMDAPKNARQSSVLVLLFPNQEQKLELVLTVRNKYIAHGGEISLPGGRQESNESPDETALREAKEETGIDPGEVDIAGSLSTLYVNHSNNVVTPIVGFLSEQPVFNRNPDEVNEIFTVPLDDLLNKQNLSTQNWQLRPGASYKVPFWNMHNTPLWGATAMILSEFMELYKEFKIS